MTRVTKRLVRAALAGTLVAAAAGGSIFTARHILRVAGGVASGVVLDGSTVDPHRSAEDQVAERAGAVLRRRVVLRHEGEVLVDASLAELGAQAHEGEAVAALAAIGRAGGWLERIDDALQARAGRTAVTLTVDLPVEPLARALAHFKERFDHKPKPAKWDFSRNRATAHVDGQEVDLYAAIEAVQQRARSGSVDIELPIRRSEPLTTQSKVAAIDRTQELARFETRFGFVGNQAGRAQNVARAAERIDGTVMMPSQHISFNERVGPRRIDNGFAAAGEIYKGEMRMGVGGGTCQVASTFHAAAFMAGLQVVERSPHSRPSGYIAAGLDATVAYPHVDLKMNNPFDFPVVIRANVLDRGTLRMTILGRERPADVAYTSSTVAVRPFKRKIRDAHWLELGQVKRKQAGRRGMTIEKTRTLSFTDGTRRVETTEDIYPPTTEVYFVNPGDDPEQLLPPLPSG